MIDHHDTAAEDDTGPVAAVVARVRHAGARIGLSPTETLVALVGMLVAIAAVVVIIAIGDDVIEGDGIDRVDAARLDLFVAHRSPWLVSASRALTQLGSVVVLVPLGLILAAWLWWRGARLGVALAPLVSVGLAGFVVAVTKAAVGRSRPPEALHLVTEGAPSFPSGHSAQSMAFYLAAALVVGSVVLRRPLVRLLVVACAGVFAVMVALTRLELGVHWPSDVAVGLCLGLASAVVVVGATLLLVRVDPVVVEDLPARRAAVRRVHRALSSPRPGRRDREPDTDSTRARPAPDVRA